LWALQSVSKRVYKHTHTHTHTHTLTYIRVHTDARSHIRMQVKLYLWTFGFNMGMIDTDEFIYNKVRNSFACSLGAGGGADSDGW
jgi:hypothetical protein